jgi:hypothetical protein
VRDALKLIIRGVIFLALILLAVQAIEVVFTLLTR